MTVEEVKKKIEQGKVALYFSTEWCVPCKFLQPMMVELAEKHGFELVKLDLTEDQVLTEEYAISSIPTVMMFLDGKFMRKFVGARPEASLISELTMGGMIE